MVYDKIGMCYYYLGDILKAKFFHEKSMDGDVEPLNEHYLNSKSLRQMTIENYEAEYKKSQSDGYNVMQRSILYATQERIKEEVKKFEGKYLSMKSRKEQK